MNSKLQIISGKYGGRKLALPVAARPTQNKARIALFNMLDEVLGANMRSQTVWDAFAGSGEFGIEFLSRDWANDVIFTDIDSDAIKTINKNLVGIARNPIIRQIDATVAADKFGAAADVIFIDPPYNKPELGEQLILKLSQIAKPGAIIIWEMENSDSKPEIQDSFIILKDKTYGRARFLIIKKV